MKLDTADDWSESRSKGKLVILATLLTQLIAGNPRAATMRLGDDSNCWLADEFSLKSPDGFWTTVVFPQPIGDKIPLILIHGINLDDVPAASLENYWYNFVQYLQEYPQLFTLYRIYLFSYKSNAKSVDELAENLGTLLSWMGAADRSFGTKDFVVVAHSMGGLVSRAWMEKNHNGTGRKWHERVLKLITLATPHHGSPIANNPGPFGALGCALGVLFGPAAFEYDFWLNNGPSWFQVNRRDLWWDNYRPDLQSVGCWNAFGNEQNSWLRELNSSSGAARAYDSKLLLYVGTFIPVLPPASNGHEHQWNAGALGISNAIGLASDGIVPYESALFDGVIPILQTRQFTDYDHSQMWQGKQGDGDLLFNSLRADLTSIAASVKSPGKFRIIARAECLGTAHRVRITRIGNSTHAADYRVWRDGATIAGTIPSTSSEFFDSTLFTPGVSHSYAMEARNQYGNSMSQSVAVIPLDCSAPVPDTTPPPAPELSTVYWSRNNLFWIGWDSPSDPSGIARVWWKLGSPPSSSTDGVPFPLPEFNPFPVSVPEGEGVKALYLWLEDGAGNPGSADPASTILRLDTSRPAIAITSPTFTSTAQSTITLSGSFFDNLSGVVVVTWLNDVGGSGSASIGGGGLAGTWSVGPVSLVPGLNTFVITATDGAGNQGTTTMALTLNDNSNSGNVTVTISPQNAVNAGAQWRVNGGSWHSSGESEPNVPIGPRFVEFKAVPGGWRTPAGFVVNVSAGQTTTGSGNYTPVFVNQPPNAPSSPSPSNGASDVARQQPVFSWIGSDPDGPVEFLVCLDPANPSNPDPPGYGAWSEAKSFQYPATLVAGTTYNWRVKARDQWGSVTDGPVWRFTTAYSYADLVASGLTAEGNIEPGAQVTLSVTVRNEGSFGTVLTRERQWDGWNRP